REPRKPRRWSFRHDLRGPGNSERTFRCTGRSGQNARSTGGGAPQSARRAGPSVASHSLLVPFFFRRFAWHKELALSEISQERFGVFERLRERHFILCREQFGDLLRGMVSVRVAPDETAGVVQLVHHAFSRRDDNHFAVNLAPCQQRTLLPIGLRAGCHLGSTSQKLASRRNRSSKQGICVTPSLRRSSSMALAAASEEKNNTLGRRARNASRAGKGRT